MRDEAGMGLIELLIAMVILNVGLFAVVGVFNGATVAMGRAATVSAASAVADKQIEIYRSLTNCAIWLDTSTFPTKGISDPYELDTKSYTDTYATTGAPSYTPAPAPVTFLDKSASQVAMASLPWSTNQQTGVAVVPWNGDIPPYCTISATTPPPEATKAIQQLAGPDGVKYWVFTYILIVQPTSGATTGNYVKQVTVTVRDSRDKTKILARQTSLFDPLMG